MGIAQPTLLLYSAKLGQIPSNLTLIMAILYQDSYLVCDQDALTIHTYYFPVGSKRIPYGDITELTLESIDFWGGAGRLWGMGLSPHWFHWDFSRWQKNQCIVITERNNWVKSVITPTDCQQVYGILREQTGF